MTAVQEPETRQARPVKVAANELLDVSAPVAAGLWATLHRRGGRRDL